MWSPSTEGLREPFLETFKESSDAGITATFLGKTRVSALTICRKAKVGDVPIGKMVGIQVAGEKMIVPDVGWGQSFPMRADHDHMGGPSDRGTLAGSISTCPFHGSRRAMRTGLLEQFNPPLPPEATYNMTEGGRVPVEV